MEKTQSVSVTDHFAGVEDPRMERTGKRKLGDIIAIDKSLPPLWACSGKFAPSGRAQAAAPRADGFARD